MEFIILSHQLKYKIKTKKAPKNRPAKHFVTYYLDSLLLLSVFV